MKALAAQKGKHWHSIYRAVKKLQAGMPDKKPFRPRDPAKFEQTKKAFLADPDQERRALARRLAIRESKLYYWMRRLYDN